MLLTALVLAIASPAAAQTAPAAGHGDHAAQHQAGHAEHQADKHAGHKMDGKCCDEMSGGKAMDCCEKMKKEGKKMSCCDHHEGKSEAGAHEGHGKH